jgi:hypothetical protein
MRRVVISFGLILVEGCAGHASVEDGSRGRDADGAGSGSAGAGTSGVGETGGAPTGGTPTGGTPETGGSPSAGSSGSSGVGASCGSAGSGDGADDKLPDWDGALDDLAGRIAVAQCEYSRRCEDTGDFYARVPGGCTAYRTHVVGNVYVAPLLLSLQAGRARYDADAMAECTARAATAECGTLDSLCAVPNCRDTSEPWCWSAADGIVPLGGECERSFDCEGTARCDGCPGTCVAVTKPQGTVEEGMPCAGTAGACRQGLLCLWQGFCHPSQSPCGTCIVPLEENDACDAVGSDSGYSGCGDGLVCRRASDGATRCLPPASEGEPCGEFVSPCALGLYCIIPNGQATGTCSIKTFVSLGEPCGVPGIACTDPGRCAHVGIAANGESDYRCVEPSASRGACYSSLPFSSGTCPTNEFCPISNAEFAQGIVTATCQPVKATGEACSGEHAVLECGDGTNRCGPCGLCESTSDVGQRCSNDFGCYSRRCISGVCAVPAECL